MVFDFINLSENEHSWSAAFRKGKYKLMKNILYILLLFGSLNSFAQKNLSIEALTGGIQSHSEIDPNTQVYSVNFEYLFEPGVQLGYQFYSQNSQRFSAKFIAATFYDTNGILAGYTNFQVKYELMQVYKSNLNIGFGPTVHFSSVNSGDPEQQLFQIGNVFISPSWISGEFEYNRYMSRKADISISLNHIRKREIGVAIGIRYWISKQKKSKCFCPNDKTKARKRLK